MTPIFTSEDVASLVTAFPPPLPTRDHPSLVRSASGSSLLNSNHVLNRFRRLLKTASTRIRRSDLPTLLNVHTAEWLFEAHDEPVRYSKDRSFIIPEPEYARIAQQLNSKAETTFISIDEYLIQQNVSPQCLDELVEGLRQIPVNGAKYLCSDTLLAETNVAINSAISHAGAGKVDLSTCLPGIPVQVLTALANEVTTIETGAVCLERESEHVVFVPALYTEALEVEKAAAFEARIQDLLSILEKNGFLEIPSVADGGGAELDEVMARYKAAHPGTTDFNTCKLDSASAAWMPATALREVADGLKPYVVDFVENHQQQDRVDNRELDAYLIDRSERKVLAELLLRSNDRHTIDAAVEEAVHERSKRQFEQFVRTTLVAPAQLYAIGAESIEDPALKERCEEHICEHFRREVLPTLKKSAQEQSDKSRSRDFDKLSQSCAALRTLADLNASLSKFTKKHKLPLPVSQQLMVIKHDVLIRKVADMGRMQRASDILQNVIWILLAQRHAGLFMSSGKDTGRMIKQYQIHGDEDIGKDFERWRDTLKKSEASESVVAEMRALATKVVAGMIDDVNERQGAQ